MDQPVPGIFTTARPKLLIFVGDLSATGVVRNAIAIANRAARDGYRVMLVTCRAEGELASTIEPAVEVDQLLESKRANLPRPFQLARILPAYRARVREFRPDVLLSAGNHGHLASRIAWAGSSGKKIYRLSNDPDRPGAAAASLQRLARIAQLAIVAPDADRLVAVSPNLLKAAPVARMAASGAALHIPNGVDSSALAAIADRKAAHIWSRDDAAPVIVAVGRIAPQKNLGRLIEAFAIARSRRNMRLVILGDGPAREKRRLKDLVERLKLEDSVQLAGTTANPYPTIAAAACLALPSLWEGSSNALLEAMALGTPVIASRTAGDARRVLGEGRFGRLVDPLDPAEIAEAILAQVGPEAILPAGRAAEFDIESTLIRYMDLIDSLAGWNRKTASKPVLSLVKSRSARCARATAATRLSPRPVPSTRSVPSAR